MHSVTLDQLKLRSEVLNKVRLALEKLRDSTYLGGVDGVIALIQWKTGKWSDKWDTNIVELRSECIALVMTRSIKVAEFWVHRVGLVIICRRPSEKSKSTKLVTFSHLEYFRRSRLMSPNQQVCVTKRS